MNRYTLMPVPGATSDAAWTVRANNDGSQIGRLALTAAYERGADGRARNALCLTLLLPIPSVRARPRHPYATCRVWRRDPWSPDPLEVHMPQPWTRGADMERARTLLADLWFAGELKTLYHKVMEE